VGRRGNPYDNSKAESFMKTLKCEEVYLRDYQRRRTMTATICSGISSSDPPIPIRTALGTAALKVIFFRNCVIRLEVDLRKFQRGIDEQLPGCRCRCA
jgi:transposase InsO family protein